MNDIVARFTSRKFLLALFGVVTVFFSNYYNLSAEQIAAITALIISFTAAEGVADAVTRYTNIPTIDESKSAKSKE